MKDRFGQPPAKKPPKGPSRRLFMQSSGLVVGAALAGCSGGDDGAMSETMVSDQNRSRLIATIADIMIPETDTPGAEAAGVGPFIDGLMVDWALPSTRQDIHSALTAIDRRARRLRKKLFVDLSRDEQVSLLTEFDAECFGQGQIPKNPIGGGDVVDGYRTLKRLVYYGYYRSEIGATQELQFALVPGDDARADVPLSEVGRTWAES